MAMSAQSANATSSAAPTCNHVLNRVALGPKLPGGGYADTYEWQFDPQRAFLAACDSREKNTHSHLSTPSTSSSFKDCNPNPQSYTVTPGPALDVDWSNIDVFNEARTRHIEEHAKRVQWCIENNLQPETNKHLAPGDDSNFMVSFFYFSVDFRLLNDQRTINRELLTCVCVCVCAVQSCSMEQRWQHQSSRRSMGIRKGYVRRKKQTDS